jgi:pre-mRNA-processing factor SLU7
MKNIAADDVTKNLDLNWEGKRDRWNGFSADMYSEVIKQY